MRRWRPYAVVLLALVTVAPACADIFATFDHSIPPSILQTVNAVTGAEPGDSARS